MTIYFRLARAVAKSVVKILYFVSSKPISKPDYFEERPKLITVHVKFTGIESFKLISAMKLGKHVTMGCSTAENCI